jgi:hypothetical protein
MFASATPGKAIKLPSLKRHKLMDDVAADGLFDGFNVVHDGEQSASHRVTAHYVGSLCHNGTERLQAV